VEVCEVMVDLLVELNSSFVKVDEHCHHGAMNAVFSNYNVTSVVRAAVISSVNLLAKVILAILDIRLYCPYTWLSTGKYLPLIFAVLLLRCNSMCPF